MDYFKKIFNKDDKPKQQTNPQPTSNQQPTGLNKSQSAYPIQNQPPQPPQIQTNQSVKQMPVQNDNSKVNVFNSRAKTPEIVPKQVTKVEPTVIRNDPLYAQNNDISKIVPPQTFDKNANSNIDNRRLAKGESSVESESMKRIITKMGNEEGIILQKLEGLEKRNFPTPFPNQPSFPDSFPNSLSMTPVSNEQLHNFSKQRIDNKRQQKEVFMNYKQETDFYKRFIPMNEVKKQRLHQEINELKQRSMIQDDYDPNEDDIVNQELTEIERLKRLAQQSQFSQNQFTPSPYQQQNFNQNVHRVQGINHSQELDYNPYNSTGYQQRLNDMSGNYRNNVSYSINEKPNNPSQMYQPQQQRPSYGNTSQPSQNYNNQPYAVNDNFNPSYNLTAFMNRNPPQNNPDNQMRNVPISQHIDAHMQQNVPGNMVQRPPQSNMPVKPKSNINVNNPLLNMI